MKIKVCGLTSLAQMAELDEMRIDYAGMIFYPASPRSIINIMDAEKVKNTSVRLKKTGVFVNESSDTILEKVAAYGLDVVQLHGDESPVLCAQISDHVQLIKAFRIGDHVSNLDRVVKEYKEECDFYLFDKGSRGVYGGTGEKFDWRILNDSLIEKPFFLSGGIDVDDWETISQIKHPFFYGIDLNSKFENSPGIKNILKIKQFIKQFSALRQEENATFYKP